MVKGVGNYIIGMSLRSYKSYENDKEKVGTIKYNYILDKLRSIIRTDLSFIEAHMRDVDLQKLTEDEVLLDSMLFRMIQISENAKRLSSEYKRVKSHLPWDEMSGLRNKIVYDYGNVALDVVFDTLKYDIPELLENLNG